MSCVNRAISIAIIIISLSLIVVVSASLPEVVGYGYIKTNNYLEINKGNPTVTYQFNNIPVSKELPEYVFLVDPQSIPVVNTALKIGDNIEDLTRWVYTNITYSGTTQYNDSPDTTLSLLRGNCLDRATVLESMLRYYNYNSYVIYCEINYNNALGYHASVAIKLGNNYSILDDKSFNPVSYLSSWFWWNETEMIEAIR